jgi:hypothetical protein
MEEIGEPIQVRKKTGLLTKMVQQVHESVKVSTNNHWHTICYI